MRWRSKTQPVDAEIARLREAVAGPVMARHPGSHHIVVANPKGGTGKTTVAALLGLNLAEHRGEVAAIVDANPHTGTLRRRLVPPTQPAPLPLVDLARAILAGDATPEWPFLARYTDLVARLRVLTNQDADPAQVEETTGEEYRSIVALLSRAAQIVISDMGTSSTGPVAVAALETAQSLVVATELTQDSLELTIEMVSALAGQPKSYRPDPDDWSAVSNGRFLPLVASAVVAISPGRDDRDPADLDGLLAWLRAVCRGGVILIPRDPQLAAGDLLIPSGLAPATRAAHLTVAAAVATRFPVAGE